MAISSNIWETVNLPEAVAEILQCCKSFSMPQTRDEIFSLAIGGNDSGTFEVSYTVNDEPVSEANVTRVRNGLAINYIEPYMRRRRYGMSVTTSLAITPASRVQAERFVDVA